MPGNFKSCTLTDTHLITTHMVDNSSHGLRADLFLKKHYPGKSRNQLQQAIDQGRITLEVATHLTSRPLKASTALLAGDVLKIWTSRLLNEPIINSDYKISFEDEHLLVIDKPGNLPVHPAGRYLFHTLVMILRKDFKHWVDVSAGRDFFLIHRLDRETSGLIVIAKNRNTAAAIIRQFFDRRPVKKYYAITDGEILDEQFDVHNDIGPAQNSVIRLKMQAYPQGTDEYQPQSRIQSALTEFKTLRRNKGLTLLDCTLHSGRQHQIRVHLSHLGYPVVGDKLYGASENLFFNLAPPEFPRHALHSRYLKFQHPVTLEWMEIESALPDDLKGLIEKGICNPSP